MDLHCRSLDEEPSKAEFSSERILSYVLYTIRDNRKNLVGQLNVYTMFYMVDPKPKTPASSSTRFEAPFWMGSTSQESG